MLNSRFYQVPFSQCLRVCVCVYETKEMTVCEVFYNTSGDQTLKMLKIKSKNKTNWRQSVVFIIILEHIQHIHLKLLFLTLNMNLPTGENLKTILSGKCKFKVLDKITRWLCLTHSFSGGGERVHWERMG